MKARRLALAAALATPLAACDAPERPASDVTARPSTARAAMAGCAAAHARAECDGARAALAEARRRERMARYEAAF